MEATTVAGPIGKCRLSETGQQEHGLRRAEGINEEEEVGRILHRLIEMRGETAGTDDEGRTLMSLVGLLRTILPGITKAQIQGIVSQTGVTKLRQRLLDCIEAEKARHQEARHSQDDVTGRVTMRVVREAARVAAYRIRYYARAAASHPELADVADPETHNPYVALYFHHPQGRDGKVISMLVGPLNDLTSAAQDKWSASRMGTVLGIGPVPDEIFIGDLSRIGFQNNAVLTKGSRGFFARERLKSLLPPALRPLCSAVRKVESKPKYWTYLPGKRVRTENGGYSRSTYWCTTEKVEKPIPGWYRENTKRELWVRSLQKDDLLLLQLLRSYIAPEDFYRAAGGHLTPQELEGVIEKQRKALRAGGVENRITYEQYRASERFMDNTDENQGDLFIIAIGKAQGGGGQ